MAKRKGKISVSIDKPPIITHTPLLNTITKRIASKLRSAVNLSEMASTSKSQTEVSRKRKRSISFPSENVSCDICAEEKHKENMFSIVGCDHTYCSECVAKYVDSKLQENVSTIPCPFMGCKGSLDPQSCQSILPKTAYDRWCDVLCESLIIGSEKMYCPFKDCSALLIDARFENEGVVLESECPECHRCWDSKPREQ